MNYKQISLFIMVFFLSSCGDDYERIKEKNKQKYDAAINQVIRMENGRLQEENQPRILRSKTGIVVYKHGEFIRLLYHISSMEIVSTYQKEESFYIHLPETKETHSKLDHAQDEYIIYRKPWTKIARNGQGILHRPLV
ncbi:hypothetical protein [Peribacillus kribbensis]|uniref:hypothetical protein n=1 Tax=Peribacillus kribbensis TaxID=356658 RepID=UPI000420D825|nr:hypothetical protein [Peribacillus kribbensis]